MIKEKSEANLKEANNELFIIVLGEAIAYLQTPSGLLSLIKPLSDNRGEKEKTKNIETLSIQ